MTFSVFRFDFLEIGIWVFFILSDNLTIFINSIIFLISIFFFWNNWRGCGRFGKNTLWVVFVFWFLFVVFVLVQRWLNLRNYFQKNVQGPARAIICPYILNRSPNFWKLLHYVVLKSLHDFLTKIYWISDNAIN